MEVPAAILMAAMLAFPVAAAQEQILLEATSEQGTFLIEILWMPADIGRENTFTIRFLDSETGREVEDITYDLLVFRDGEQSPDVRRTGQTATVQKISFDQPGQYIVKIEDIDDLGEGAQLPMRVTPEFPLAYAAMAGAFSALVVLSRRVFQ